MPHARAMIGHGGFGTTMTGLANGVPMVVVPLFAMDQFFNARASNGPARAWWPSRPSWPRG
jgi:UDP:flavonoid glycosyltransferase YjiC (YdhE family)